MVGYFFRHTVYGFRLFGLGLDLSILRVCQTQTSRGAKENVHRPKLQKRYYNCSAKEIAHFMGKPTQSFGLVSSNMV